MPTMMNNSLFAVAIDCADAAALARFWADVLGRQVAQASTSGHAVLLARGGDTSEASLLLNEGPAGQIAKNRLPPHPISATFRRAHEGLPSPGAPKLRV